MKRKLSCKDFSLLDQNPFAVPLTWRKMILDQVHLTVDWRFDGKSFICALINTECPVGCAHCMFATIPDMEAETFQRLDRRRISKLLRLVEDSNAGYFLVSSAGEPFLELDGMYKIARESRADYTWMVTSGLWALNTNNAASVIENLYHAFCARQRELSYRRLFLRVSVDKFHVQKIANHSSNPLKYLLNIVSVFEQRYSAAPGFNLMLHSLEGEERLVDQLADALGGRLVAMNKSVPTNASMHPVGFHESVKRTEKAMILELPSGYCIEITFAKRLLSDLTAPLHDTLFSKRLDVFDRDAFTNEGGNTAVKFNADGSIGPNILVSFDGSVALWQSEMPDVNLNLDKHDYKDIISAFCSDPGVLATIENGLRYRFDIIGEVNQKAVLQSKAVNLRDYTSKVLLEEDRTKLYYTIRVLRDYIELGRIDVEQRGGWPKILNSLVTMEISELQKLYQASGYDIIRQMIDKEDDNFQVFIDLLNMTSAKNMRKTVKDVLKQGLISNQGLLERCHTLFRRISRGWYNLDSVSDSVLDAADGIAEELSSFVQRPWRRWNQNDQKGAVGYSSDMGKTILRM